MFKSLILVFLIPVFSALSFSFLSQSSTYNESRAREFWYYQVMSECNFDRIQSWNVPPVSSIYPRVSDIQILHNYTSTGANMAYVAFNPDTNTVILSVRGSHNDTNQWEDIDFFKVDYEKCPDCSVHQGFYHAYLDLKGQIMDLFVKLSQKYPTAQTAVFGHSLGGAIATFAVLDLLDVMKIDYFYTFGSPRLGNDEFADFVRSKIQSSNTARIVHFKDNVPHLPFRLMGFRHVDGEIFYNVEDSSKYTVCAREGEDSQCSTQFYYTQTDGGDHGKYMNFPMDDFTPNCH